MPKAKTSTKKYKCTPNLIKIRNAGNFSNQNIAEYIENVMRKHQRHIVFAGSFVDFLHGRLNQYHDVDIFVDSTLAFVDLLNALSQENQQQENIFLWNWYQINLESLILIMKF